MTLGSGRPYGPARADHRLTRGGLSAAASVIVRSALESARLHVMTAEAFATAGGSAWADVMGTRRHVAMRRRCLCSGGRGALGA
jgi:hypothetical protein